MTELEQAQALEAARECVRTSMPYALVGEARLYHYHADTKRWYVEVDVTHANEEEGAAMVLCRVSYNAAGQPSAMRVTIVERPTEPQEYTLYWHPSEQYTARLANGNDTPLWGSERLEVKHGDRWIPGKVGQPLPGVGGLVLWPRKGTSDKKYITLTVGSVVRNVSKPQGDGGGPDQ